jgi:hypothetical protein
VNVVKITDIVLQQAGCRALAGAVSPIPRHTQETKAPAAASVARSQYAAAPASASKAGVAQLSQPSARGLVKAVPAAAATAGQTMEGELVTVNHCSNSRWHLGSAPVQPHRAPQGLGVHKGKFGKGDGHTRQVYSPTAVCTQNQLSPCARLNSAAASE